MCKEIVVFGMDKNRSMIIYTYLRIREEYGLVNISWNMEIEGLAYLHNNCGPIGQYGAN